MLAAWTVVEQRTELQELLDAISQDRVGALALAKILRRDVLTPEGGRAERMRTLPTSAARLGHLERPGCAEAPSDRLSPSITIDWQSAWLSGGR
jgi:hypothetical protein